LKAEFFFEFFINLGEFVRVRSHTQGEAFNLTLDFDTSISTVPGFKYFASVYTLISCPKVGCESSKDSVSVKLKDGVNGNYREVYSVNNRINDMRWIKESFNFTATQNRTYVRIYKLFSNINFNINLIILH
jgi:hypothetical protein